MLRLAAYIRDHPHDCTRADIARDVPGYQGKQSAALEKLLQRDLDTLEQSLGIRVQFDEQRQVYRLRPPFFAREERIALITAAAFVDVDGLAEASPAELGGGVDEDAARATVLVHDRVVELRDAIATRSRVRFRYKGTWRTIEPYALGLWRTNWYVAGTEAGTLKKFRLDRFESEDGGPLVVVTGEPGAYDIPATFDAETEMRMDPNAWGNDPPVRAVVRISRDQAPVFLHELGGSEVSRDAASVTIAVEVREYPSFITRLLGFGTGARLLEPRQLVDQLREWLAPQAAG
ncbi:MAG: WYL domain-containing protein [Actinobacteria bacterium]|nr:WYL domain-containing protein [Actinomycetota bacterium]